VETVISFDTVTGEVGGDFDLTRFTPNVPGFYFIVFVVRPSSTSADVTLYLRKNGVAFQRGDSKGGVWLGVLLASTVVYCDGVSDYLEASIHSNVVQPLLYSASSPHQFFGFKAF
jgi:hypothetical protein